MMHKKTLQGRSSIRWKKVSGKALSSLLLSLVMVLGLLPEMSMEVKATDYNTLQINLNNGEAVLTRVVSTNSPVGDLPVPKRDGYTFGGWFTDSTLTTPYDPRMIASSDFAVYAKWTPKKRGGKTGGNGGGNTGGGSGSARWCASSCG